MDNLDRAAMEAQRAGMSYGQYMAKKRADSEATKIKKSEPIFGQQKRGTCAICAKPITDKKRRKYCSSTCACAGAALLKRKFTKEETVNA